MTRWAGFKQGVEHSPKEPSSCAKNNVYDRIGSTKKDPILSEQE
jgi:hypothetical protein